MNNIKEYVKLGDVCQLINGDRGKNYPSGNDIVDRGVPFINAGHLQNNKINFTSMNYISKEKYHVLGSGKIKKDDILYCLRGSLGKHALCEIDEGAIASSLVIIRPNKKILESRYLMHYLDSDMIYNQQIRANNGSSQPNLSANSVKQFKIYLPNYDIQVKISSLLDKAQELIDKRKEQIEALDELVKSRFIEMFGNLYINDKNWKEMIISDYCKVKGGKRVPKGEKLLDKKTDHPYLRVLDLKNSTVLEGEIKYLSNEIHEKIKRYTISSDDVYLTNVGEKLGMAGTIPQKFNNANLTENAVKLVFDNRIINKIYLAYYLNSEVGQKYILERKMIVGVPKLAIFRIETLPLVLPPIELQNQFADFVNQVDKLKFDMEKSLKELEDNFNSLMQRAFKGELFT